MHRVANLGTLKERKLVRARFEGKPILLVRIMNNVFALESRCGEGCKSLASGIVEGFYIRCPWYHEYYDIRTGEPLGVLQCKSGIKTYKTKVDEKTGDVFVYL